jgi:hypothetical protein
VYHVLISAKILVFNASYNLKMNVVTFETSLIN